MARDVEFDVTAHDKTGPGLDSVARRATATAKKVDREYERFGNRLGDRLLGGVGAVSPKIARRIADSMGTGARLGAPLLISGISAALPAVSAIIGGAVAGGAAGLGIVGGVALAARDVRVQNAAQALGQTVMRGLEARSTVFVGPTIAAIGVIEHRFRQAGDRIESIFAKTSRQVIPTAAAVGDAAVSMIEGIDNAVSKSGPTMREFQAGVRGLGEATKSFFTDVTADADASARGISNLFATINGTITTLGATLGAVNTSLGWLDRNVMRLSLFQAISDLKAELGDERLTGSGTFGPLADNMQKAGLSAEEQAEKVRGVERALAEAEAATRRLTQANAALFDDTTRLGAAEDDLRAARRRNGKTLDENTEKGRANRTALSGLAQAMNAYRQNLAESGSTTVEVNGVLGEQRGQLIRSARQFGLTRMEARRLADQLLGIPRNVETKAAMDAAQASRRAKQLRDELADIPRSIVSTVTIAARITGSTASRSALQSALNKQSLRFAAGPTWTASDAPGGGRTEPARPVAVTSTIENTIYLDGRPFRAFTAAAVADSERRQRWRQRVGGRG